MPENILCMTCAGIALVAMLGWSFWMAYRHTRGKSCHHVPASDEGEVSLDDITSRYLKLTNLE